MIYCRTIGAASLLWASFFLALTSGCSGDGRLDVAPVRGKVVYQGVGVPKASVIFFPGDDIAEHGRKLRPFADSDAQGNFVLKTYIDGDGAPPGKYRVCIIAAASGPSGKSSKDRRAGEESSSKSTVAIPQAVVNKYRNVDTAGIEVIVHEGENNLEPFVLTPGAGAPRQSARSSGAGAALIRN
jgi:hypothetical protein